MTEEQVSPETTPETKSIIIDEVEGIQPIGPTIDPALESKVGALRAISTTHNLLNEGHFKFSAASAIFQSQEFLKQLHHDLSTEVLAHPDHTKIEELVKLKAEKENEQKELAKNRAERRAVEKIREKHR